MVTCSSPQASRNTEPAFFLLKTVGSYTTLPVSVPLGLTRAFPYFIRNDRQKGYRPAESSDASTSRRAQGRSASFQSVSRGQRRQHRACLYRSIGTTGANLDCCGPSILPRTPTRRLNSVALQQSSRAARSGSPQPRQRRGGARSRDRREGLGRAAGSGSTRKSKRTDEPFQVGFAAFVLCKLHPLVTLN